MLEPITVLATKTLEKTWESMAAVSSIRQEQIDRIMPSRTSDLLNGVPGVWVQERADDPGTAVNIRGLQDFGRVAVVIDGARQNFQRTGHNADGVFYLDPELIGGVDVVRGPVANIYGSGAIGGVVSFTTKDVDDVLQPGQVWGSLSRGELGSNQVQGMGSTFFAVRPNANFDFMVGAVARSKSNYHDANGNEIENTKFKDWSGIAKATFRPADGHQVKFGFINFDTKYNTGQTPSSIYSTEVDNQIANARWIYSRPGDRLFDFDGNVYWTRTATDQLKTAGTGSAVSGRIGDKRNFTIETVGFDARNTSRFDTGPVRHALTYGGDAFRDEVDTTGFGTVFTPSGERTVSGAFAQLKSNFANWLEVISAVRYDQYGLTGGGVSSDGSRVSPKVTVGITPVSWITPYVTYAEGYRAPAVTETLVTGTHPVFPQFDLLPNPLLRPEIGKTKEAGVNLRFDNVLAQGDAFRAKANVYRNDVEDFIEFTLVNFGATAAGGRVCTNLIDPNGAPPPPPFPGFCQQYQNIPHARLEGVEVETSYDAGSWFGGVNYSHVKGRNADSGEPLAKIPPGSVMTTLGTRLLDRKLTLAVRWQWVAAKTLDEIPLSDGTPRTPVFPPTEAYNVVNFYAGYTPKPGVLASLSIENLLNEQYARYMTSYPSPTGTGTPIAFPQPGLTVKGSLKIQFGQDAVAANGRG